MKIKITDISVAGEGIGRREDGKVCFVQGALPGEELEITITEEKGNIVKAVPAGEYAKVCGGCPLLNYPYDKQLAWKQKHVRECLERIGGFNMDEIQFEPIIGMEKPYAYRNKLELKTYATELPAKFCNVNCKDCSIQDGITKQIAAEFAASPVKNAEELIIRTAKTGEYMAFTIQKSGYPLIFRGENLIHDYIDTDYGRLKIEVDPQSFYQVNAVQTGRLYSKALEYAALTGTETLLDLYCGAGTIGLLASRKAARVIGVESVKPAVVQANRNAVINGIVNATFICGKAEEAVKTKLQGVNADVVVVDPPRAGCKESLLKTIKEIGPKRVVYVSCNPSTLARDLKYMCNGNVEEGTCYSLQAVTPVDMFPHTTHVETVVLMSRNQE